MSRRKKEDDFEYKEKETEEEVQEQFEKENNTESEEQEQYDEDEVFRENFEVMYQVKNAVLSYVQELGLPLCEKLNMQVLLQFANEIGENFDK